MSVGRFRNFAVVSLSICVMGAGCPRPDDIAGNFSKRLWCQGIFGANTGMPRHMLETVWAAVSPQPATRVGQYKVNDFLEANGAVKAHWRVQNERHLAIYLVRGILTLLRGLMPAIINPLPGEGNIQHWETRKDARSGILFTSETILRQPDPNDPGWAAQKGADYHFGVILMGGAKVSVRQTDSDGRAQPIVPFIDVQNTNNLPYFACASGTYEFGNILGTNAQLEVFSHYMIGSLQADGSPAEYYYQYRLARDAWGSTPGSRSAVCDRVIDDTGTIPGSVTTQQVAAEYLVPLPVSMVFGNPIHGC